MIKGCKDGKNDLAYNNKGNGTLARTANDVKINGKPVERLSAFRRRSPFKGELVLLREEIENECKVEYGYFKKHIHQLFRENDGLLQSINAVIMRRLW